ncbi:hypothetical protein SAMN05421682_11040 [Chryseobacterium indoltheticum]|uniref:Uncharacterized protein n=2 Tax=Chryseobacterium group TaxID=2782232 RepID=A0A381FB89_9FLAO|nr:hypothetical protein SAMN05421682_11040 [Chryseobacterium indoltheticum]SUX43805.1 Uncharacterised protein [Chryseobacterium indoltheticum]
MSYLKTNNGITKQTKFIMEKKLKKMSFAVAKNELSRKELKGIMAGSGGTLCILTNPACPSGKHRFVNGPGNGFACC